MKYTTYNDPIDNDPSGKNPSWKLRPFNKNQVKENEADATPFGSAKLEAVLIEAEASEVVTVEAGGHTFGIVNSLVPMDSLIEWGWPDGKPDESRVYIGSKKFEGRKVEYHNNPGDVVVTIIGIAKLDLANVTSKTIWVIYVRDKDGVLVKKWSPYNTSADADAAMVALKESYGADHTFSKVEEVSQTGTPGAWTTTFKNDKVTPDTVPFDWTWIIVGIALLGGGLAAYFLWRHYSKKKAGGDVVASPGGNPPA
jgi:predicted regulator of Ras-like GTPase activity (Roadblock/LC7/MglB family)